MNPIIIIGAGLAGWTTARELRKLDTTTPVMMITADSGDFYAKPSLSNAFAQKRGPDQLVTTPAAKMAATLNVNLLANTSVQTIDPIAQTVATPDGTYGYRHLVLATGAQPIRVPVSGDGAALVRSINSLDDFRVFHTNLLGTQTHSAVSDRPQKHVLIMGAGLIGCEFANDLALGGYAVSVVDPSPRPLAALLPQQAAEELQHALSALGVQWHFGATVQSVERVPPEILHPPGYAASTEPNAYALRVTLSNGIVALADSVLSAIGLRADATLAQAAGLRCGRGILVDSQLRTSAPHIFALGDGAQYASAPGAPGQDAATPGSTLPYVMPIMNAARALAATLAGTPTELAFPLMPVAIKTPALPITISPPAPGLQGQWYDDEPGLWKFVDANHIQRGFTLTGTHTSRRMEQVKLTQA